MSAEYGFLPQADFEFESNLQTVEFVETVTVNEGVVCDVYSFSGDPEKDLGIIRIQPGHNTPLQRVLGGTRTIEGHISGTSQLSITRKDGEKEVHLVNDGLPERFQIDVNVGDLMQWQAAENSNLVAYEICFPPYVDGRYENIE